MQTRTRTRIVITLADFAVSFSRHVYLISCAVAQGHGHVMILHPRDHGRLFTRCTFPNFFDTISVADDLQLELILLNLFCAVHFFNARLECQQPPRHLLVCSILTCPCFIVRAFCRLDAIVCGRGHRL